LIESSRLSAVGSRLTAAENLSQELIADSRSLFMTIDSWHASIVADAERRNLPELKPFLEALARAARLLRTPDFSDDASR
jgi:hypothetical protein